MDRLVLGARVLLALPFLVFGLDGLFEFLPRDVYPEHGARAAAFQAEIVGSGYLWELLKVVEVTIALALLTGRFVPMALAALVPVLACILGFHLTMEREGTGMAIVLIMLTGFLGWSYRQHFAGLLAPNAKPAPRSS